MFRGLYKERQTRVDFIPRAEILEERPVPRVCAFCATCVSRSPRWPLLRHVFRASSSLAVRVLYSISYISEQ